MKQFTIYIGTDGSGLYQDESRDVVREYADTLLAAYTMYDAVGCWEGTAEFTFVVTVLAGEGNHVWDFARAVRRELTQECVLVTQQDVAATFVTEHSVVGADWATIANKPELSR